MTTTTEKILERAAHYEQLAAALRLAAHELNGHQVEKKQAAGVGAMLAAAVQVRAEQRQAVQRPARRHATTRREKPTTKGAARRETIRRLLSLATAPLSVNELRQSVPEISSTRVLQILGELGATKIGKGNSTRWVWTPAHQALAPRLAKKKRPGTWAAGKRARRERSAAILAKFDASEPRPLVGDEQRKASGLLRRGYLRKKGDGYIRTGKEFQV